MKNKRVQRFCFCIVLFQAALLLAQESGPVPNSLHWSYGGHIPCRRGRKAPDGADGIEEKSLYPALFGGLFANTVFHVTARMFGADFAQTSPESVKTNLTSPWIWDNDAFLFNHPGHPYQGGLYHAAARSNGFGFYESVFFDTLGSLTWELFGETDIPSLNDLVITTFGGAAFGEMLHLLYLELRLPWAAALVSPMDALNNAVLGKKPPQTHNLYYLSTMAGAGWIRSIKENREQLRKNGAGPAPLYVYTGNLGCEVVYGDPFAGNSNKPYSHFEAKMQLGGSFYPVWLDWTILTDGYLVLFTPLHTNKDTISTGLTLQYDLLAGDAVNFASNGLDWSLKWKHLFKAAQLELKSHTGWTFFGSSEYYPFDGTSSINQDSREADNGYGVGGNLKLFFSVQTRRYGKITAGVCNYLLYSIPWNKPDSGGVEFLNLTFLEYSYHITDTFSGIVNNSLYLNIGTSRRRSNVFSLSNRIFLGVQWVFLNKGRGVPPAARLVLERAPKKTARAPLVLLKPGTAGQAKPAARKLKSRENVCIAEFFLRKSCHAVSAVWQDSV